MDSPTTRIFSRIEHAADGKTTWREAGDVNRGTSILNTLPE